MSEIPPKTYPHGVTCWIDTEQPDVTAASYFYGQLFGWTFADAMPPNALAMYLIAQLDGSDVAAIGSAGAGSSGPSGAIGSSARGSGACAAAWNTYIAVTDADATATQIASAGGSVLAEPSDAGHGGRTATCADPQGAHFRLWQPNQRLGAQSVNAPGTWNFSDLHTTDLAAAKDFYTRIFGWKYLDFGPTVDTMVSVPGYGDHLAVTADPDIYERQKGAPPGFADVIGAFEDVTGFEQPRWQVKFSVTNRDEIAALAEKLGGSVIGTADLVWALLVHIRDPQGAEFTVSQFRLPEE